MATLSPLDNPRARPICSCDRAQSNFNRRHSLILRMDTRFAGIVVPEKAGTMCGAWVHAQRHLSLRNLFRSIVTADSENQPKSVTFDRKDRSRSAEISGHVAPESPVTFGRNMQPTSVNTFRVQEWCISPGIGTPSGCKQRPASRRVSRFATVGPELPPAVFCAAARWVKPSLRDFSSNPQN